VIHDALMGPWRTIVVDDEPLARQTLRLLLSREKDFAVVAECGHGAEAIDAIRRERPDVLFLDVQMPEVDGFELLRGLGAGAVPVLIFVTAFDRYALKAFEQHALDYLLKPFSDERFSVVIERARVRLRERSVASSAAAPRQLIVRDGSRRLVIPHDDIVWIEAEDYCARIHLQGRTMLVRESLSALARALAGGGFVRVHRSAVVNVACIRAIEPLVSGDQRLTLSDGVIVKVSRTHRADVVEAMERRPPLRQATSR
jgi:two-component system, LytTR family, response regulator